jgi:hypothetical protein
MKPISSFTGVGRLVCPILLLMAGDPAPAHASKRAPNGCGDFLAQAHKKPAHLSFIECSYFPDRQGRPLRAIYHVEGRFAAGTEAYLIKSAGLAPLQRFCCQWDSAARQFRDASGREFSIAMVSDETPVASRADWGKITTFEVVVETYTEDL